MNDSDAERTAVEQFRGRLQNLSEEALAIHRELRRKDMLVLAQRTQELVRLTRVMLEGNLQVLFGNEPVRIAQNLKQQVDFADNHVVKAIGEEHDFEIIQKRLYMATALAQYVVREVSKAVDEIEQRLDRA